MPRILCTALVVLQGLGRLLQEAEDLVGALLDADVTVFDTELSAIGNYGGASVTLQRSGGASSEDVFSFAGDFQFAVEGGALVQGGVHIGTVVRNSGGVFQLLFNEQATQVLINSTFTPPIWK